MSVGSVTKICCGRVNGFEGPIMPTVSNGKDECVCVVYINSNGRFLMKDFP